MSYKDIKKLIKKGELLELKGNVKAALKNYKEALKINKNSKKSFNKIGEAYIKLKKYEKAMKTFEGALKIDPNDDTTHANIAYIYEKMDDYPNAIKYYKQARKINPEAKDYKESIKKLKSADKDTQRAEKVIEEKNKLSKLRQMVSVSDNINLNLLMRVLKIDRETFEDKIFGWAEKYSFRIDNEVLIINKDTVNDFIEQITNLVSNEKSFCQYCGNLLKKEEILENQDFSTGKCSECNIEH